MTCRIISNIQFEASDLNVYQFINDENKIKQLCLNM